MSNGCVDSIRAGTRLAGLKSRKAAIVACLFAVVLCVTAFGGAYAAEQSTANPDAAGVWRAPGEWITFPFDNPTVSIQSSLNNPIMHGNGRIEMLLLGGSQPLADYNFSIYSAIKNITGQWSISGSAAYGTTDDSGFVSIDIKPGQYALTIENFSRAFGQYGIEVKRDSSSSASMIPFAIAEGEILALRINFAKLSVGVTSEDGKSALTDKPVYVYPEALDVVGNPIPLEGYGDNYRNTTAEGISAWLLGAGVYTIRVDNWNNNEDSYMYHLQLSTGEEKQIIMTGK